MQQLSAGTNMTPIMVSGFNRDVVIETNSSGPPYTTALEFNSGEGTCFYQSGLAGKSFGLPATNSFTSAADGTTVFQFQPYTTNNALILGPDTGITNGTLTFITPLTYNSIAVIANSGNGTNFTGPLTINFIDGSSYVTTYFAPNWFNNATNIALQGVERISLSTGTTSGSPGNPRFHQTTINLASVLGSSNKPISSLTFGKALANTTGIYAVSGAPATNMTPIAVTGFNRDIIIESNSAGPAYTTALEFNPGEGTCFYQSGLPGTSFGLPASGSFTSASDGSTLFGFQPYTASNALVLSSETSLTSGTLTLATPGFYSSIAVLANSASGGGTPTMALNFSDGSSFATNFNAPDWFFNTANVALLGVDRINISSGGTDGGSAGNPRFYQTTINVLAIPGASNKLLKSITFGKASGANATAIYAVSGLYGTVNISNSPATLAVVTNQPASATLANSASLNGQVLSTGGDTPQVTIYYGTNDGGANASAWAQSIPIGFQSGSFSSTVFGLSSNTTYYFTAAATNSAGLTWATPSLSFTTLATNPVVPLVSVLTYHYDNARDGVNTNEVQLTPANVNSTSFGQIMSYPVDGYIYGQPLVVPNVTIPGKGTHNVVYITTEHDSVYAFDADGSITTPFWQVSFLNPGAGVTTVPGGDVGTGDITPEIGITTTPVIDPVAGTIYLEAKTKEVSGGTTKYVHRLHALDITTGAERANSPVIINSTNYPGTGQSGFTDNDGAGHVLFNTLREHSRPALTLLNGVVYIGFASHGDNQPYHGWLFAYNATTLAQISVFNSTPNGGLGGFWQGGGGATIDSSNFLYYMTGNGTFDATGTNFTSANNFAMSVLKFTLTNGTIKLVDYFSPFDEGTLSGGDSDLGSGAAIVLPDSVGTAGHPHLLAAAGKGGRIYLIDRDNMGRFNGTNDQIVQEVNGALGTGGQNGSYMTPAFFNNTLYYIGMNDTAKAFPISGGLVATSPSSHSSTVYGDKGSASPTISANGTNNAILWAIENDAYASSGPAILHAYNAFNLAQEYYNSSQNMARDNPGGAVKFATPTVANGHVYVGAEFALGVYGVTNFLPNPVISPNGGTFTNSVTVTLSDTAGGTTLYYTLDGTTPTTNSFQYSVPFVLTNSAGVSVIATKPGSVRSAVTTASFVNSSSIGTGTGLLGNYWTTTTSAAFTNSSFNTPPTLTRTDPTVNFNWGTGSPDPSISVDQFCVRWTGSVQPQFSQTYTFSTTTDDGVRVWINNQLIIDHWVDQGPTTWSGTYPMQAQQRYNIRMDYYENGGGAQAMLAWSSPSTANAIIPQTQLYTVTNPPPAVSLIAPTNSQTFTASASVTLTANAAAQYNSISNVAFYSGSSTLLGIASNNPYTITVTGLPASAYLLKAVVTDMSGLATTSAPVTITVNAGTGQPYGLASRASVAPFLNMPNTVNGSLPPLLSQTGVFTNTPALGTISALVPYSPITPLWSDGAVKTRWFAVPNTGAPYSPNQQITFAPTGEWSFPSGTVFVKHFELVTNLVDPNAPRRRLETRLLVRDNNGMVYGVTYKWRADNSDADLLSTSLSENITITNAGGTTTQTWYYPSPSDCLVCHTPAANYVLGVKTRQLNSSFTYPSTSVTDNQLRTLNHLGLFNPAIDEAGISNYTQLVAITNQSAQLVDRARSYLDANCAQCHRPGGPGPTFDGRWDTPLASQNIINAILAKGDLGYDNAKVVVPQDIWRSVLYDRMNTTDSTIQMPTIARNLIDTNAVAVMAAWINSLPGTPALAPPVIQPAGGTFTHSVSVAMQSPTNTASVYYTLDGSLPTTNSQLYSTPFNLTNSATLRANAFLTGFNNSVASNAVFTILPGVLFTAPGNFTTNGSFQVSIAGLSGKTYILQASSDLKNWTNLTTNTPSTIPFTLSDPGATNFATRFYRAVQLP